MLVLVWLWLALPFVRECAPLEVVAATATVMRLLRLCTVRVVRSVSWWVIGIGGPTAAVYRVGNVMVTGVLMLRVLLLLWVLMLRVRLGMLVFALTLGDMVRLRTTLAMVVVAVMGNALLQLMLPFLLWLVVLVLVLLLLLLLLLLQ